MKMIEKLLASIWNWLFSPRPVRNTDDGSGIDLGLRIVDGEVRKSRFHLPEVSRCQHIVVEGKSGQGKSRLLYYLSSQDIRKRNGFIFIDFHAEAKPFLLRSIAAEERRTGSDLSERLVVIAPGDAEYSVGLNLLEGAPGQQNYVQLAEFAQILKSHWGMDSFGARTEELLRNSLQVLTDNNLTLLELSLLLTNPAFRGACLNRVTNPEVISYFRTRFDTRSEAMQSVYRDAILNKVSEFVTDRRFRHLLGQQRSTFSLVDAMDRGLWIILDLDKGQLGEQVWTVMGLFLTKLKNALFARRRRSMFSVYGDEIQNISHSLDTILSEARKYHVGIVTSNQFLDQFPVAIRAAIMAAGTHAFFQLSPNDADKIASALDGGKHLAEILKNLPKRHMIVKTGGHRHQEVLVPSVDIPNIDYTDLYNRCRARWARRRTDIEAEIRQRHQQASRGPEEALNDWE